MNKILKIYSVSILISFIVGCAYILPISFDELSENVISDPDKVLLLSLEPDEDSKVLSNSFHNHVVLGQSELSSSDAKLLMADIRHGATVWRNSIVKISADCFNPRHGLRFVKGNDSVDFLICFECFGVNVFRNNEQIDGLGIWGQPDDFNRILKDKGVPLPKN